MLCLCVYVYVYIMNTVDTVQYIYTISDALKGPGIHLLHALATREYNPFEALTKTPQTFVTALLKW